MRKLWNGEHNARTVHARAVHARAVSHAPTSLASPPPSRPIYVYVILKELILEQARQNRYQTIPFSVYIHNMMFVFILEWVFGKEPYTVVILPLIHIGVLWLAFSSLKQLILEQARQNGYQTIPFSVYIHNLMFVFILEWVFWKEPWYSCDFTTCSYTSVTYD